MSVDRRVAEMVFEIAEAGTADTASWRAAGEPKEITLPASLALRDRLLAEDRAAAEQAYGLLVKILEAMPAA